MVKIELASSRHTPHWAPFALLAAGMIVTTVLAFVVYRLAVTKDHLRFDNSVQKAQDSLDNSMDTYIALLRAGSGLFAASDNVSREEFKTFAERLQLQEHYPGVQGIGFALYFKPQEKDELLSSIHNTGLPDFNFNPDYPRSEYTTILYLEPMDKRNQAALGYDMFSEPVRREAMVRARDTGQPAASGKVSLLQEIDQNKQAGFLIYFPIYENKVPLQTVAQRQRALKGYIYSPFRADDLLNAILGNDTRSGIDLTIYDGDVINEKDLLHKPLSVQNNSLFSLGKIFKKTAKLDVAGRVWTIQYITNNQFVHSLEYYLIPLILFGGWGISFMAFILALFTIQARDKAEQSAAKLRISQQVLKKSERLKDEFLSIASHELKTPVTSLKAYTQVLYKRFLDKGDTENALYLGKMDGQLNKLTALIKDLLDVSKIEAGQLNFMSQLFDINRLIGEVVEDLQRTTKHQLVIEGKDNIEVYGDRDRMGQVLINLLSNAIKYSPERQKIIIKSLVQNRNALVSVQDFGVGIPEEEQKKIFNRFYRVDGPKRETFPGLGLGLYITAKIVTRHGGRIWVESNEGKGSTFSFTVPLSRKVGIA